MRLQSQNEMQLLLSGKTPKHCYVFGHYTDNNTSEYVFKHKKAVQNVAEVLRNTWKGFNFAPN